MCNSRLLPSAFFRSRKMRSCLGVFLHTVYIEFTFFSFYKIRLAPPFCRWGTKQALVKRREVKKILCRSPQYFRKENLLFPSFCSYVCPIALVKFVSLLCAILCIFPHWYNAPKTYLVYVDRTYNATALCLKSWVWCCKVPVECLSYLSYTDRCMLYNICIYTIFIYNRTVLTLPRRKPLLIINTLRRLV